MTSFKKSLIIACTINTILLLTSFAFPASFLIMIGACLIEIIGGLLLLIGTETRSYGQGILLAGALGLLIGLSVCTAIWSFN